MRIIGCFLFVAIFVVSKHSQIYERKKKKYANVVEHALLLFPVMTYNVLYVYIAIGYCCSSSNYMPALVTQISHIFACLAIAAATSHLDWNVKESR